MTEKLKPYVNTGLVVSMIFSFVIWTVTLDKRITVIESTAVTKEDLTPIQISLAGLEKSVKHNQSLIIRILDKK